VQFDRVIDDLPHGFDEMRAEASAEGYRHLERLALDWASGAMRFKGAGETLLAVHVQGALAAIGGLTIEAVVPGAFRMRRLYVREPFRRQGIGRNLALALIEPALARGGAMIGISQLAVFKLDNAQTATVAPTKQTRTSANRISQPRQNGPSKCSTPNSLNLNTSRCLSVKQKAFASSSLKRASLKTNWNRISSPMAHVPVTKITKDKKQRRSVEIGSAFLPTQTIAAYINTA